MRVTFHFLVGGMRLFDQHATTVRGDSNNITSDNIPTGPADRYHVIQADRPSITVLH
jgi:hypothetical protein